MLERKMKGNPVTAKTQMHIGKHKGTTNDDKLRIINDPSALSVELAKGFAVNRCFLHLCVKRFVKPHGLVLDLGSGRSPTYMAYLDRHNLHLISADGNSTYGPDLLVNLERNLPLRNESVDSILLFNVLEHIYNFQNLLKEMHRVLKPEGKAFILVPLLIKIHGSPSDYFRYTHIALRRMLSDAGFTDIEIYATGGVIKLLALCFSWLAAIKLGYLLYPLFYVLCAADSVLGAITKGRYTRSLPIGYFVSCVKEI